MKKLISVLICFLMILNILPIKTLAEEQSLEEIIRPQIEAFAKSIDQSGADGKALDAVIAHGIGGNGKKLSVGKKHALTATLMNSELTKEYLTNLCAEMIRMSKEIGTNEIHSLGAIFWQIKKNNFYYFKLYDYDAQMKIGKTGEFNFPKDELIKISTNFSKTNGYDESLELIAGGTCAKTDLKADKISDDKIVYKVSVTFADIFNFDTDNSSALEDLLGWVGLLLFEPFEWEAKCDFQIEIPIEKPEENVVFGDSDGNGSVDVMDAYFARLVAAKLVKPTEEQLAFCDVDSDGKITAIDANLIRKYALGIIRELPVR